MLRLCAVLIALSITDASMARAQGYQIRLLQVPPSPEIPYSLATTVTGVSASGMVVGTVVASACNRCTYPPPYHRGFIFQNETYQVVDTGSTETRLTGINDSGVIVGYVVDADSFAESFLLQDGRFTYFEVAPVDELVFTYATGINNRDEIVGHLDETTTNNPLAHGFAMSGGINTVIAVEGQRYTYAQRSNDQGVIVGYYGKLGAPFQGLIYNAGSFSALNYPGSISTRLVGINNDGVIAGTYTNSDGTHGSFLYDHGEFHPFSIPNACSVASTGINNQGVVYGSVVFGPKCGVEFGFVATPAK